ncbi:MAG: 6-phosphogluconolactonase [Pseudonocardiaceae bacterium]|nr:6-phosphogluconolactonase [Pseudonocardiaceae bacterium]
MTPPGVVVHTTPDLLAAAVAARLVTRVVDAQAARGQASIVLTGGGIGIAVLRQLAAAPAAGAIDWSRVDLYWGDERFLPTGHPDRNETQAREALLDHVRVRPERVHVMGASDGDSGDDPDIAARDYARLLARHSRPEDHGDMPSFDVCLLGIGEEGHVASIFPSAPAVYETERTVVGVRGCPQPPPRRVTLTLPAIRFASQVWVVAAGASKAAAVSMALAGAGEVQVPAAGATGRRRTLWLLDRAAATKLPKEFTPPRV